MSISYSQITSDLKVQNGKLQQLNYELQTLKDEASFVSDVLYQVEKEWSQFGKIDWEDSPNRNLLDQLYNLKGFEDEYPIYCFKRQKDIDPFIQKISDHLESCSQEFKYKQSVYQKKQSDLEQYQQQVLRIINQIGQLSSTFLR